MKILLTGYPGFIGRRIVKALAQQYPSASFVLLVERALLDKAQQMLEEAGLDGRCELLPGNLVNTNLGIDFSSVQDVTDVWHLAAIYNLSVEEEVAKRINVDGTRRVVELCKRLQQESKQFNRFMYFSTCYVAGDRGGEVFEAELKRPKSFHNFYESTKHDAEIIVRQAMGTVPTTIVRPAIVVGDSKTGDTDKYDGPYYILQLLLNLPSSLPLSYLGAGTTRVNMVPVDFIVDASLALFANPEAEGQTCHLSGNTEQTTDDFMNKVAGLLNKDKPSLRLPTSLLSAILAIKPLRELLGLPQALLTYFDYDVRFDTQNTDRLLEGSGVSCPEPTAYLETMLNYVRANPGKTFLDKRLL